MTSDGVSDILLLQQIARGQTTALEALYDRYNRLVFSIVLAIVGEHSVAEEVTLDVFVHVWRGATTYEPGRAKVTTWLTAVARHHAIDVLRWQSVRVDSSSLPLDDMTFTHDKSLPDVQEQAELSAQRMNVQRALSQLPIEQRQALFLAYFKGYSQQQIAERLKQPLGTVKTRIRLAMQKLRQILAEEAPASNASEAEQVSYLNSKKD
jgi:RNA polymerase sigma-70 factor (ECF subfamily)